MIYAIALILCWAMISLAATPIQAVTIQGRYYTVDYRWNEDDNVHVYTRRPGFKVYTLGDSDGFIHWQVGVLEYELTQEAIDNKLKAYFYLPKFDHDDIFLWHNDPLERDTIAFHITNASALALSQIANKTDMVLADTIDAGENWRDYRTPDCINATQRLTPFAEIYPFSACHFKPVEIDFFNAQDGPDFKAGETLTIVVSLLVGYYEARSEGGVSDPYGLFAAGVRLGEQPLRPMASASDVIPCGGATPTILGTHNADTIHVPRGANHVVLGLSGDDLIVGNEGPDKLCGGADNDKMHGNGGADYLHGGSHSDIILAGQGEDEVVDTSGHNVLIGAGGHDRLTGSPTSVCVGNSGRDRANRACGIKAGIEVVQD